MGMRRIRMLCALGVRKECIAGYDRDGVKRDIASVTHGIQTYATFKEAIAGYAPHALVISTSPESHSEYFLYAARTTLHFFCEVTTTDKGYKELLPLLNSSFVAAPSCTYRFSPAIVALKKELKKIGKLYAFTYHVGQYLPSWHPWEDYRNIYFSKKKTGACREMFVYDFIWLLDLLGGSIKTIKGVHGKVSNLEMTADDVYAMGVILTNKVMGTFLIDLLSKTVKRSLRIVGEKGVVEWDWKEHIVRVFEEKKKKWETKIFKEGYIYKGYTSSEDMYEYEMKAFIDAIKGKRPFPYTYKENSRLLLELHSFEH